MFAIQGRLPQFEYASKAVDLYGCPSIALQTKETSSKRERERDRGRGGKEENKNTLISSLSSPSGN